MTLFLRAGALWRLKREILALAFALRDHRTPFAGKFFAIAALLYLISPVDVIADLIPLAGILDDLLVVPLGLSLSRRHIPPQVMEDARVEAMRYERVLRWLFVALALLVLVWLTALGALGYWLIALVR